MTAEADDATDALTADNLLSNEFTDFPLEMAAEESVDGHDDARLDVNEWIRKNANKQEKQVKQSIRHSLSLTC